MLRALTTMAAIAAFAVSAATAVALGSGDDRPMESLSFAKPKPPSLGTRSGGEVITADAYAKRSAYSAARGIVVTKATDVSSTKLKPRPLSLNTFGGDDTL